MPQAGDEAPFQLLLDTITTYLFHYYLLFTDYHSDCIAHLYPIPANFAIYLIV